MYSTEESVLLSNIKKPSGIVVDTWNQLRTDEHLQAFMGSRLVDLSDIESEIA